MDINSLNKSYGTHSSLINTSKNDIEKNKSLDFSSILAGITGGTNDLSSDYAPLPAQWADNPFGIGAIENAVSFLSNNYNIDVSALDPTYEITDDQRAWLENRHDLSSVSELNTNTSKEQNLLADLVYLNIIPSGDAKKLSMVYTGELTDFSGGNPMPTLSIDVDSYNSYNYFEKIQNTIDKTEQWAQWANKENTPAAAELAANSQRIISGKEQILRVLKSLS